MGKELRYSTEQRKQLLALGVTLSDIRASEAEETSFSDALELATTSRSAKVDDLQADADRSAKATKRALRPENDTHSGISVYNPKGEPWPTMPYEGIWIVEPVNQDNQSTVEEIRLFMQLEPGEYKCERSDGSVIKVTVKVERNDFDGRISRKTVWFDTRNHLRHNLPSKAAMMRDMIRQHETALVTA
jgi:hypothetical protein